MKRLGLSLILIAFSTTSQAGMQERRYKAAMSEYFMVVHKAVPLFTNGNITKGDIVQYPEEAVIRPLKDRICFNIGKAKPRDMDSMTIHYTDKLTLSAAADIPAHKIAKIEAELGGTISQTNKVVINPASRLHTKREPNQNNVIKGPECEIARLVARGFESKYIIASEVLRGKITAEVKLTLNGSAEFDAKLTQKKLKKLLGSSPKLNISGSGKLESMVFSRSPSVRSIAIKSRFVSPWHLGRLNQLYEATGGKDLDIRVRKLMTGTDANFFEKYAADLRDFLERNGLIQKDPTSFYNRFFYGEGGKVLDNELLKVIPQEHWRALGIVVAAHELAVWGK